LLVLFCSSSTAFGTGSDQINVDYTLLLEHAIEKTDQKWLVQFNEVAQETIIGNLHCWHSSIQEPMLNALKGTLTSSNPEQAMTWNKILITFMKRQIEKKLLFQVGMHFVIKE